MRTGVRLSLLLLLSGCGSVSGVTVDATPADATTVDATTVIDTAPPVPDACRAGVTVEYTGTILPSAISGFYDEAFDCTRAEGGAFFGGVDFAHCFRKSDNSAWRIWNTGCGWEIGLDEGAGWNRHARYYMGVCSNIPPVGLTTDALTTTIFYDGFGGAIAFLSTVFGTCQ